MGEAMKSVFLLLTVLWLFNPTQREILQESSSLGGPWTDIAGPYQLRTNGLKVEYFVPLTKTNQRFFRVRATNGVPWL